MSAAGLDNVCPQSARQRQRQHGVYSVTTKGSTGAKSDVYDCLVIIITVS